MTKSKMHSHICIDRATSTNVQQLKCKRRAASSPLPLAGSRLAAHCIERQCSPIGTDSRDALAPQQVADNLISSLFLHTSPPPPLPEPTTPPCLHGDTWPAFWVRQSARHVCSLLTDVPACVCASPSHLRIVVVVPCICVPCMLMCSPARMTTS